MESAVLSAKGLAEPVGDLAPVLDDLTGQHPGPHPIHISRRPDRQEQGFVDRAKVSLRQLAGYEAGEQQAVLSAAVALLTRWGSG
jgi:hypothetical protein